LNIQIKNTAAQEMYTLAVLLKRLSFDDAKPLTLLDRRWRYSYNPRHSTTLPVLDEARHERGVEFVPSVD